MATGKLGFSELLEALYDSGAYTPLLDGEHGIQAAFGMVGGQGAYAVCQGGKALGTQQMAAGRRVLKLAAKTGNPIITFYNAPGAKLQEGQAALEDMRALTQEAGYVSGVVPQIAVVTGVCGASAALAAATADICIMVKDAQLFLTPPFISKVAGNNMEGAGGVQSAVAAGVVSLVAETDADAVQKAARLVAMLPQNNLAQPSSFEFSNPVALFNQGEYTGNKAIDSLADEGSAIELFEGFGNGVVTSLCTMAGSVVGITATNGPESFMGSMCAARAARFARMCDAYSIPLVTVINTAGFEQSSQSDQAGTLRMAARLAATYADTTTAKIAVLAGRTFGPVYTALAGADLTVALQGSITAPAEPSAMVSVLYKSEIEASDKPIAAITAELAALYEAEMASAKALQKNNLADFAPQPEALRGTLVAALDILSTKRAQRMPKKHGNMPL